MKNFLVGVIFSGLIVLLTGSAWAHSDEGSSAIKGVHGGQLVESYPYHLELVAKDGELKLYVTDHNNLEKVLTRGGSAKANVLDKDGNKVSVQLLPIFSNLMKGTGDFKITPETVVSVFVVVKNNKTNVARFTSLVQGSSADGKEEAHDHHHGDAESNESATEHDEHESSAEQDESDTEED